MAEIQTKELSSLLFTVTSTALPRDFYFFKLMQPLTVSVQERGLKPDRKPYPLPYGLRNPYRNIKSENSQDYAQKPIRNCTYMNSASGEQIAVFIELCFDCFGQLYMYLVHLSNMFRVLQILNICKYVHIIIFESLQRIFRGVLFS